VQQYSGSSIAAVGRLKGVAESIAATRERGTQLVVVVSAMDETTDELLALTRQVSDDPDKRELELLMSAGERISMSLLCMALHALGVEAITLGPSQAGLITDDAHIQARILEVQPRRVLDELASGRVVIVAGHQGVSRDREITTLGRNDGETVAVALAAALDADVCEVYTDAGGVYTADPALVPAARRVVELSHGEMQELALSGSKVLNAQAVEFARDRGIVIHARSLLQSGPGTLVTRTGSRELHVSGISLEADVLVVRRLLELGPLSQLTNVFATFVSWPRELRASGSEAEAIIPLEDLFGLPRLLSALQVWPGVRVVEGLCQVSLVGSAVGASEEPLRRSLEVLAALGKPDGVYATPRRLSFLLRRSDGPEAVRLLHRLFVEAHAPVA
jgi:aspartate kinase